MSKTAVSELGEFGLIEHLTKNVEHYHASSLVGIGDDAAIIDHYGKQTVITSDMLVEDIHFDLIYTPLKHLGYKSIVVNISDLCAMGAIPTQVLVALAISSKYTVEALTELYEGIYQACRFYQVDLIGGDTCPSSKGLTISITAIGEIAPNQFIKRSGAKLGDLLCVTGDLGAAYLGLMVMEKEKQAWSAAQSIQPELEKDQYVISRLLKPEARTDLIEWNMSNNIKPTSMIDISDGLSSELIHLCKQSDVGCMIYEEKIPINQHTKLSAMQFTLDPTTCALHGGEDYELLFTISPDEEVIKKIQENESVSIIGHTTAPEAGFKISTKSGRVIALSAQGWQAFDSKLI